MFNSKQKALQNWEKEAARIQPDYCEFLGDRIWNSYKITSQKHLLKKWIRIGLHGLPQEINELNGLTPKEMKLVEEILEKCIEASHSTRKVSIAVFYASVYVSHKKPTIFSPVFRVKSTNSEDLDNNTVIDGFGRVYESWSDFKENNTWVRCWICFPPSGFYNLSDEKSFEIFDYTSKGQAMFGLDIAATVVGTVSGAGAITGIALTLFPPTAVVGLPILITSLVVSGITSAYGAGRSIYKLRDRNKRKQSLLDLGAGVEWMGVVFGTLGVVLAPVTGGIAAAANVTKAAATIATRVAIGIVGVTGAIANISSAGAGIAAIVHSIGEKESLTDLDVRKLQDTLLFLRNVDVDETTISTYYERRRSSNTSSQQSSTNTVSDFRVVRQANQNFRIRNERRVRRIRTYDKFIKFLQSFSVNSTDRNSQIELENYEDSEVSEAESSDENSGYDNELEEEF